MTSKYREDGVFSIFMGDQSDGTTLGSESAEVTQAMQEFFHIRDDHTYNKVENVFYSYLNSLASCLETSALFCKRQCSGNINFLQKSYLKTLASDDLDESALVKSQGQCMYAKKNTPFGRNRIMGPKQNTHLSYRVLNYDWDSTEDIH